MLTWLIAYLIPFVLSLFGVPTAHTQNDHTTYFQAASASTPVVREPAQQQPETPQWILRDKTALRAAQQALTQLPELQGAPIQIYEQINFFDGTRPRIEIDLQDPKQPENILYYTYENGKWSPTPISEAPKPSGKNFARHLVPLTKIDFAQAADIAQAWQQKAQSVNAVETQAYHVALIWLPKQQKLMWHTAQIDTNGARYYLSFHADGSVWEFKEF